jgi:hypothetical protein
MNTTRRLIGWGDKQRVRRVLNKYKQFGYFEIGVSDIAKEQKLIRKNLKVGWLLALLAVSVVLIWVAWHMIELYLLAIRLA